MLGIAMIKVGEKAKPVITLFQSANDIVLELVMILMKLAPIGVFCLIAKTFATEGFSIIYSLIQYFLTVALALALHFSLTYGTLFSVLTRLNPLHFFKKMLTALSFAFSTASSNATIPVTMKVVEEDLGVDKSVASFTVPLGATINMDGTAIMQGVATVFIAGVYAVDLSFADYLTVILTATLASIGTAGVPGVGLIMLALVLHQVNLPVEGIALIIGVDRLLDMMRTAVNITGDAMVTCVVAKSEQSLSTDTFNNK
jgi:Na+/H+-dicarboxylate symporter